MRIKCLPILVLLLTSANAEALTLMTETTAEGTACCRPNGGSFSSITLFFRVQVFNAPPAVWGSSVAYRWVAKPNCDFFGPDLTDSSTRFLAITSEQVANSRNVNDFGPQCPFGLRSKSTATLFFPVGFPALTVQDLSQCAQPCYGCDGLPFVE